MKPQRISFTATESVGKTSGLLLVPRKAIGLLVFAHGAGAGMRHPFMEAMSLKLAEAGIGTLRFHFPYMEKNRRRPDAKPLLVATVRSAVKEAARLAEGVTLFAGGKSMGGRMTSLAQAEEPLVGVRGLVFFGFPLHPPGKPSTARAEHLESVMIPMLFLQGSRDEFAELSLLTPLIKRLKRRATLHLIEQADHSFHVPKSSGKSDEEVLSELSDRVRAFVEKRA